MSALEWLSVDDVLQIHDDQIERYGGSYGFRDRGALEGCVTRPRNLIVYATPDIFELAASYSFGLVKNHCFVDGNKRTGFATGVIFLLANDFLLTPTVPDAAKLFEDVAAGVQGEKDIAEFFRAHSLCLSDS